ncbi:MAG: hypothetical protein ACQEQS_05700 [Thermodesulfobacteriota bacterium]
MENKTYTNPFIKSRVDSPFQHHPDLKSLYTKEFSFLNSLVDQVKDDSEHQSTAVTVTGEPGTGKTHLAMRLTSEKLCSNRIFYIRQPSNHESVLHFIYSKMLESFCENVNHTGYSQLFSFLGKSVSSVLVKNRHNLGLKENLTGPLKKDPMSLFSIINEKNENFDLIKEALLNWWESNYSLSGLCPEILKSFLKYGASRNPEKRRLVFRWINGSTLSIEEAEYAGLTPHHTDIDQESFALEAMNVISRLSVYDQPLIFIFDQLEGLENDKTLLYSFMQAIKEILTSTLNSVFIFNIFESTFKKWVDSNDKSITERLSQNIINLSPPEFEDKKEILKIRAKNAGVPLDIFFTDKEVERLAEKRTVRSMLINANHLFVNKTEGIPIPAITETAEDKTAAKINELFREINFIKQYLNIRNSSPAEIDTAREIDTFFKEKAKELTRKKSQEKVYSETEDTGKIIAIAQPFIGDYILETGKLKASRKKLPEHILFSSKTKNIAAGFLHMNGLALTSRLKNLNSMCENYPDIDFYLMRDASSSEINAKGARNLIQELLSRQNFSLLTISEKERLNFELIYELILSIQNRDLDIEPVQALSAAKKITGKNFIFEILEKTGVSI